MVFDAEIITINDKSEKNVKKFPFQFLNQPIRTICEEFAKMNNLIGVSQSDESPIGWDTKVSDILKQDYERIDSTAVRVSTSQPVLTVQEFQRE